MIKRLLLLVSFFSACGISFAQTYLMQNGTVNVGCTGNFYDTGGSGSNHGMAENLTITLCAPAGNQISLRFTSFAIGTGALFNVYDGPNTSSPLIGSYNSTVSVNNIGGSANGTITASCRCITISFLSNVTTAQGWAAIISCTAINVNPACTNMGFETGTTAGWIGRTGTAENLMCICNPGFALGTRHTIMSGAGVDPFGGFPVVAPGGGTRSFRLGNSGTGAQAEQLIQKYRVSSSNTYFVYKYAVVLEDPGHAPIEQPFFRIRMFAGPDCDTVSCGQYFVAASAGVNGFQDFPPPPAARRGIFKPWTTVGVNLSPYVGQEVTVEFTTGDCSQSAHFGYAYIDGDCGLFTISSSDSMICNPPVNLCAPAGYATYNWSPGGATTQCINVTAAGAYSVTMTSFATCVSPTTLNYNVQPCTVPLKLTAFTAVDQKNTSVLLKWETTHDSRADRFEVERSVDGTQFQKIGEVNSALSLSSGKTYQLLDDRLDDIHPEIKVLYYRLRQISSDGKEDYSGIVTVKLNRVPSLLNEVSYNASENSLRYTVNMESPGSISIKIFNSLGKLMYEERKTGLLGSYELSTDVSGLSHGAYFLQVISDQGNARQQLFMK
jgi:hypothetical protein